LEGRFRANCAPALHIATVNLPGWQDMIAPNVTMDDLIERTVAEIAARAPREPVRLVGYSLGGHVAFGAARVLKESGHEIRFLGILDTTAVPLPAPVPQGAGLVRTLRYIYWETHNLIKEAQRARGIEKMAQLVAQFLTRPGKERLRRFAAWLRRMPLPTTFAMFLNRYLSEEMQRRVLLAWLESADRTRPLRDVPVVLFRSEEHAQDVPRDLGWGELCPRLRIVNVAGGHQSMLRAPHVDDLCARFTQEADDTLDSDARQLVARPLASPAALRGRYRAALGDSALIPGLAGADEPHH
jgi:thioesterase domain-containing protein